MQLEMSKSNGQKYDIIYTMYNEAGRLFYNELINIAVVSLA
jgi:hypothetical protein